MPASTATQRGGGGPFATHGAGIHIADVPRYATARAVARHGNHAGEPHLTTLRMQELVLVTRDGCANTPVMRRHLEEALQALGRPIDYRVIDLGTLPASDCRRGYPTPTLLGDGVDLFGMEAPTPPFPEPG